MGVGKEREAARHHSGKTQAAPADLETLAHGGVTGAQLRLPEIVAGNKCIRTSEAASAAKDRPPAR